MKKKGMKRPDDCPYVRKGGLKLEYALDHFDLDVKGYIAADLGSHIGGFTDCLLQKGARKVYSVDTAYGVFAWTLRNDERVILFERTNAMYWQPPELVDVVIIDLGWTRQDKSLVTASKAVKQDGIILSLVKPQYEAEKEWLEKGVLSPEKLEDTLEKARSRVPDDLELTGEVESAYPGGGGNLEYWFLLKKQV